MSIAEFSAALQEQAYKKWFKASQKNILVHTTSDLRKSEQEASKTSFTISESTIKQISEYLSGGEVTEDQIKDIKDKMVSFMGKKRSFNIAPNGDLYFPRVSFGTISTILDKGFSDLLTNSSGRKISDIMEKGHVFGIASNILTQTINNLGRSQVPDKAKKILIDALNAFEKELIEQDKASANIKDPEYYLYAKYRKNPRKYLVEMQLKTVNQNAGLETRLLTNQLRKFFNPENYVMLEKSLAKDTNADFIRSLLSTKGSPSYFDLLAKEIANTIEGKKESLEFSVASTLVAKKTQKINTSEVSNSIKKDLAKVRKLKATVQKLRNIETGKFTSLASLQSLLNQALTQQIKRNMGNGGRRDILNLRSGRFAESVKVERMSQSREGMITTFYNYMKYPYQTFEPGFKQGRPTSRDPKLLISKSIREIAATMVGNKLRAVRL
jgi:hypothetical protein